jgi:hypothetical protein
VSITLLLSVMFSLYTAAGSLTIFLTTYLEGRQSEDMLYSRLVYQMHGRLDDAVDELGRSVELPAREVAFYDPDLRSCSIDDVGRLPDPLVHEYQAYATLDGTMSRYAIESVGIVMRRPDAPLQNTTEAYSWEVSAHPACTFFVYSRADAATWPQLHGFCGFYNGSEGPMVLDMKAPHLEPVEQALYANPALHAGGAFLPISRSWIDPTVNTLIYVVPIICEPNKTYAIAYAEKSLKQLDDAVHYSGIAEEGNYDGALVFIVEVATGLLVASSVPDQTISADGNRTRYTDAPDSQLRAVAGLLNARAEHLGLRFYHSYQDWQLGGEDGYLIYTQRVTKPGGLDWLAVCAIPYRHILGPLKERSSTAVLVFVFVTLFGIAVACATVYCCVTRPIRAMMSRDAANKSPKRWLYWISEVQLVANGVKRHAPPKRASTGITTSSNGENLEDEVQLALEETPTHNE